MSATLELLRQAAIFSEVGSEALLRACAGRMRACRYEAGQFLFARGDAGHRLLLIVEGRVRLTVTTEEGRELSVRHAARGDLLGEIAVLDGGRRSTDAIAIGPVAALALERSDVDALLRDNPEFSRAVIAFLCRRLRDTTDQLEGIALYPIEVRLARFLLAALGDRKPEPGRRLPLQLAFSQRDLAMLLGATRPKVNAALASLEAAGALRRTEDRLFCDPEALARRAALHDE